MSRSAIGQSFMPKIEFYEVHFWYQSFSEYLVNSSSKKLETFRDDRSQVIK